MESKEPQPISAAPPIVYIVEDDDAMRSLVRSLTHSIGLTSRTFPTGGQFLEHYDARQPGCVVLDLFMPGMSGLELQEELNRRGAVIPLIFMTGHSDVASAVAAVRRGAFNYLQKPFRNSELIENVRNALDHDRRNRDLLNRHEAIRHRLASLTPREREVLELIVRGLQSKVMAAEMHLSTRTVELHRARVMDKMGANSIAQLVRMFMDMQRVNPMASAAHSH
jgi:two-component system, LuxR family, response regulator FixJ